MRSPCDPPKFDQQDWSQFDFSRWHLDGLQLDPTAAAIADLTSRLFSSAEWVQNVRTTLPEFQKQALAYYQEHSKQLEAEKAATAKEFDERIVMTRDQSAALARANEAAAAPLVLEPITNAYHASIKVTDTSGHLGLPGLMVQLMDPRKPDVPLVEAATDADGNAVFFLAAETAKEFDTQHTAFRVVDPAGKVLQKIADGACIRLNQTETKVIPLEDSPDIQSSKSTAVAERSRREDMVRRITAKVDLLQQQRDDRLRTIDCKIQENQKIIAAVQAPPTTGTAPPPKSGPQTAPGTSTPASGSPPTVGAKPATGKQAEAEVKTPPAGAKPATGKQAEAEVKAPPAPKPQAGGRTAQAKPPATPKKGTRKK